MTAEFAVALPAVVGVLVVALVAMSVVGDQVRLQGAAAGAARLIGRGDSGAAGLVERVTPGASLAVSRKADLVCAEASLAVGLGPLLPVTVSARACSLDDAF